MENTWRTIKIPCRVIERIYGNGNFDDAGDELIAALRSVCDYPGQLVGEEHVHDAAVLRSAPDYPGQINCRFSFDSSHPNPWYHVMVFEIRGIADAAYKQFLEKFAALGWMEGGGAG